MSQVKFIMHDWQLFTKVLTLRPNLEIETEILYFLVYAPNLF